MVIEQLRAATAESHKQLEAKLFPFINSINNNHQYGRLLNAFYGYLFPVQELIAHHIDEQVVPDMDTRRNAGLIALDLGAIGIEQEKEVADRLPAISNHAAAMGALYVMEGSTLGGKIISKTIAERLGKEEGLRFFRGYGAETGPMWKKFTQYLEDPKNAQQADAISEAAVETFTLFGTWFDKKL